MIIVASGGKHAAPEYRKIAENGLILNCLVGSGVHGLSIKDQDDEDRMGICVEPPEYVVGLRPFDQYIYRSQPEGARSGPGDLDYTCYSLRKWTRLALAGNPTILLPLFVPYEHVLYENELGDELRDQSDMFLSRRAGDRFLGYLDKQRQSLLSRDGKGRDVTRQELVDQYGFDSKFCAHMVRLGWQGVELLETGTITLPMPEPKRQWLRDLRVGKHTMEDALDEAAGAEVRLKDLVSQPGLSPLPPEPDWDGANRWLVSAYQRNWRARHLIDGGQR